MNNQKIISITLIVLGSFLEIFYYYEKFFNSGAHWSIAIIQGIALTILLMGLFLLRTKWYVWFIIVPLGLFSIYNTSDGQQASLYKKVKLEANTENSELIKDLERQRDRKLKAYESETLLQESSFETMQDRAYWKSSVKDSNVIIDAADSEIDDIENEIRSLRKVDTTTGKIEWFQIALSFFIAIMAPVGLIIFPTAKKEDWKPLIEKWVHTNWTGIRSGQGRNILSREKFLEFIHTRGGDFTIDQYDKIKKAAIESEAVDNNGITIDNETIAIKAIKRGLK